VETKKKEKKMKKLFVLFVAVAATISSFAATKVVYFNRVQFQWSKYPATVAALDDAYNVELTVPFVYKGTVALKADWAYEPALETLSMPGRQNAKCLINAKSNLPAVMTLCQPCIDCYPCDVLDIADQSATGEVKDGIKDKANIKYTGIAPDNLFGQPGWITTWNLYLVTAVDKKNKLATIVKINLLADENKATFFTGAKGKNMYVKVKSENGLVQMQLTGAKSDYKFKFYENFLTAAGWDDDFAHVAQTAYIKSAKALNGTIYYNRYTPTDDTTADTQVEILDVAGTVKLSRDASWTGKAINGAFAAEVAKQGKGWDDCTVVAEAANCEEYFYAVFEDAYFNTAYKKYDWLIVEATAEDAFAEAYEANHYRFAFIDAEEEEEEEEEEEP
jgi:hypothetical protein